MICKIQLTPSFYLTDELGDQPRLVHRQTGKNYGPDEILEWYPSWGLQPCRQSVKRAVAILQLNDEESSLVTRFCS